MPLRVGINGAGRIGRALIRLLRRDDDVRICAVNEVADAALLAGLLRHDSVHGAFPGEIKVGGGNGQQQLIIEGRRVRLSQFVAPEQIDWATEAIDVVVEATGRFARGALARSHLRNSVGRVIVTAVCPGADETIVLGIHDGIPGPSSEVISTASCTTHAAALPLAAVDEDFGVEAAQMTTIHCTTGSQQTIDGPHPDPRRARSCLLSMIPTTTSACAGIAEALPGIGDKVSCLAVRVPTSTVSLVELVISTRDSIGGRNVLLDRFRERETGGWRGLLGVAHEPLVSIDYCGDSRSSIIDAPLLELPGERLVRLIAWYDNEWGYASRVADLLRLWSRARREEGPESTSPRGAS